MVINHNIAALNTYRQLSSNTDNTSKSLEKLSSGLRINKAGDDAAGLAISEKMRGQIRGLDQAASNAQNGISLLQTAEGALNETHSILQRMRELAVQSATDTNTSTDRNEIQKEVDQLASEITRVANTTEFNTQKLLNGGVKAGGIGAMTFQIGANAGQNISLSINAMDASALGVAAASYSTSVQAGATAITSGTISGALGAGIVNGANLTVSVANDTGASASGVLAVGGGNGNVTVTAAAVGTALNGVTITFGADSGAAVNTAWNGATSTLTVTADWDNSATSAPGNLAAIETAIRNGLQANGFGAGAINLTQSGAFAAGNFATAGSISIANGRVANNANTVVTINDGAVSQQVVVADTAPTVNVTNGRYQGLSIDTTNATIMAGTLTVNVTAATSAQFAGGVKTADAVANKGIDVSTQASANAAITAVQTAIETVSGERSKLGAMQNRFEHTIANLGTSSENLSAAESRIRDVDMAKEMMNYTKNNILSQAAQAMLAQANQAPQGVLQLLR